MIRTNAPRAYVDSSIAQTMYRAVRRESIIEPIALMVSKTRASVSKTPPT
jgi:hypothetical protein